MAHQGVAYVTLRVKFPPMVGTTNHPGSIRISANGVRRLRVRATPPGEPLNGSSTSIPVHPTGRTVSRFSGRPQTFPARGVPILRHKGSPTAAP